MDKEAYLYKSVNEDKVERLSCQRRCIISEGRKGWCYTRVNRGGKLHSLIYGEVAIPGRSPNV